MSYMLESITLLIMSVLSMLILKSPRVPKGAWSPTTKYLASFTPGFGAMGDGVGPDVLCLVSLWSKQLLATSFMGPSQGSLTAGTGPRCVDLRARATQEALGETECKHRYLLFGTFYKNLSSPSEEPEPRDHVTCFRSPNSDTALNSFPLRVGSWKKPDVTITS